MCRSELTSYKRGWNGKRFWEGWQSRARALVTGAASGIGAAFAEGLAAMDTI